MEWSGHRTMSMLQHYHIIDLDDLRRAGRQASDYRGPKEVVVPLSPAEKITPESFDAVLARSAF